MYGVAHGVGFHLFSGPRARATKLVVLQYVVDECSRVMNGGM